jgi:dynein heavy chain, axonemal
MLAHLARISRILSKPLNGHGLLIGLGGNGRKTLSKLACFINACTTFKVDITGGGGGKGYTRYDWVDDMKNMFKTMGIDNKRVTFQLIDSEIKGEYFMEDIASMLNVGEISGLYTQEEQEEITFEITKTVNKKRLIGVNEGALLEMFRGRCRQNLHIILFFSPAGTTLRQYIR